jgi:hypothetical protein
VPPFTIPVNDHYRIDSGSYKTPKGNYFLRLKTSDLDQYPFGIVLSVYMQVVNLE